MIPGERHHVRQVQIGQGDGGKNARKDNMRASPLRPPCVRCPAHPRRNAPCGAGSPPRNTTGSIFSSRLNFINSATTRLSPVVRSSISSATGAGRQRSSTRNISCSTPIRRTPDSNRFSSSIYSSARTSSISRYVNRRKDASSISGVRSCSPIGTQGLASNQGRGVFRQQGTRIAPPHHKRLSSLI